jgi:hypothetical protein
VAEKFCKELGVSLDLTYRAWEANAEIDATERELRVRLESELEEQKRRTVDAARADLQREVKRDLEARWAALSRAKREELGRLVLERLHASRVEVEREMNLLLAESYRRGLVRLAERQRGKVTRDEESGSVIDLEITL